MRRIALPLAVVPFLLAGCGGEPAHTGAVSDDRAAAHGDAWAVDRDGARRPGPAARRRGRDRRVRRRPRARRRGRRRGSEAHRPRPGDRDGQVGGPAADPSRGRHPHTQREPRRRARGGPRPGRSACRAHPDVDGRGRDHSRGTAHLRGRSDGPDHGQGPVAFDRPMAGHRHGGGAGRGVGPAGRGRQGPHRPVGNRCRGRGHRQGLVEPRPGPNARSRHARGPRGLARR